MNKFVKPPAAVGKAQSSTHRRRMTYRAGSQLAKIEAPPNVSCFVSKQELAFLRVTLQGLAGQSDSFHLRYRVLEAAAGSPDCTLQWWPPTEDMLAIIERSYRATLGWTDAQNTKMLSLSAVSSEFTGSFKSQSESSRVTSPAMISGGTEIAEPPSIGHQFNRTPTIGDERVQFPDSTCAQNDKRGGLSAENNDGLSIELVSDMYQQLVRHEKEQTLRFDAVIAKRAAQLMEEAKYERIREEEAEKTRLETEKKEQEANAAILKKGGKGARTQLARIRAQRTTSSQSEAEAAALVQDARTGAAKLHAKAWPGGTLTNTNLEQAFQDLPERPSGSEARYFYDKRAHYCNEALGRNYLATEGFSKLVRDLGHLQADLAAEKKQALQKLFKRMDTRHKGEVSLKEILSQIETEERNLLMPMVDALLKTSDANDNGLLDIEEFPVFHMGWLELHRIFEVYDDCRLEETWVNRDHLNAQLSFAEIELLSSVFLAIKSKVLQARHQVAPIGPVIFSLDLTTPEASEDEIDATLATAHVHSDSVDFSEFINVHRQMRWLRTNAASMPTRRGTAISTGHPEDAMPVKDAANRSPPNAKGKSNRPLERIRSVGRSRTSDHEEIRQRIDKVTADKLSDEQRQATKRLALFERRKRMSHMVSTLMIEGVLKSPVGTSKPFGAQLEETRSFSSSSTMESKSTTQERSARDLQEFAKLLRNSPDLEGLPKDTMMQLTQCASPFFFQSKATMYDLKDWGSGFWIIVAGLASVYMRGPGGQKLKVSELRPGQCFGEMFLLFGEFLPRRFKVEASTDGVLAVFVDRENYYAIGLDAYHRSSSTHWESLSKKHTLLLQMQSFAHLEPIDKFHLCYQLRERTVMPRTELYNADTDAVDAPKAEALFRDASVLQEKADKHLFLIAAGCCDVWVDAPAPDKRDSSHERDLSDRGHFALPGSQPRLYRVTNVQRGAIFGSFATGPKVKKVTSSDSSSATVFMLQPDEALQRLRREGIQKIFQQRDSREEFIVTRLETAKSSQKEVGGFIKGERDLKQLGTMLNGPSHPSKAESAQAASQRLKTPGASLDAPSSRSMEQVSAVGSVYNVKSQYSASSVAVRPLKAATSAGGKKPAKCHIPNKFKASEKTLDLIQIMSSVRRPVSEDKSHLNTRGVGPSVPAFSKTPDWLDNMGYRSTVPVSDKLKTRESEAQHKIVEAFLVYENWQNLGKAVDLHRFLELMKASHLLGNKLDPRDNLLSSITLEDCIEVFKQVSDAAVPTASLIKGRNSIHPQFLLSRFGFTQCMNLVAARLRVPLPDIHNFPTNGAIQVPKSNKAQRVGLNGAQESMDVFCAERANNSMQTVMQEQLDLSRSGRPGTSAYHQTAARRPATSCGFTRAIGLREKSADTIARGLPNAGPQRPHSSLIRLKPSRPGSACVVSMLVSSSLAAPHNGSSHNDAQATMPWPEFSYVYNPPRTPSAMDQMYGQASEEGVIKRVVEERCKRTRSIKRSLKRLRLPVALQLPSSNPRENAHTVKILQDQLYGHEPPAPALHWISPWVADNQLHAAPTLGVHEHLYPSPVFFSSLSHTPLIVAQQEGEQRSSRTVSTGLPSPLSPQFEYVHVDMSPSRTTSFI